MKGKILVTGGTGYIGSHTVVELQQSGYEVVIVDNLSNSRADVVDYIGQITGVRPAFEQVDCLDRPALEEVFCRHQGIEAIIHFAASKLWANRCRSLCCTIVTISYRSSICWN